MRADFVLGRKTLGHVILCLLKVLYSASEPVWGVWEEKAPRLRQSLTVPRTVNYDESALDSVFVLSIWSLLVVVIGLPASTIGSVKSSSTNGNTSKGDESFSTPTICTKSVAGKSH